MKTKKTYCNQIENGNPRNLKTSYNHSVNICRILSLFAFLAVVCDKASPQFAATQFLILHLKMRIIFLFDPWCHGLYNCTNRALNEAGYYARVLGTAVITNYKAGTRLGWSGPYSLRSGRGGTFGY